MTQQNQDDKPYLFQDPKLLSLMTEMSPHNRGLGMEIVSVKPNECIVKQPYRKELVGNPDTGVVHGGLITTVMDSVCGMSVFARMTELLAIATLDLRLDYLHPATPGQDLYAKAICYKQTADVAFVRAIAYNESEDDPFANCVGIFVLTPGNNEMFANYLKQVQ